MAGVAEAFRRCLVDGDVAGCMRLWKERYPSMPQPEDMAEAEIVFHQARTAAASIDLRLRAWSHAWLRERGLPSALPDELRSKAERMYPVVMRAVGVAVKASSPYRREEASELERRMADEAGDMLLSGEKDDVIRERLREIRRLFHAGALRRWG